MLTNDFVILEVDDAIELEHAVKTYLENGWHLCGDTFMNGARYCQSVAFGDRMLDKAPLRDLLFAIGTAIGTDFFDWARNIIQDHPESELVPRMTSELNRLEKELKDEKD